MDHGAQPQGQREIDASKHWLRLGSKHVHQGQQRTLCDELNQPRDKDADAARSGDMNVEVLCVLVGSEDKIR
jgi:hypothetical protein